MTLGIILVLGGLLALFLEFFLPGGILALMGSVLILAGIVVFIQATTSWVALLLFFLATSFGIIFTVVSALRYLRRGAKYRTFFQDDAQEGYIGASFDETLIGKEAVADSDFRPSGVIVIAKQRVQAVAKTGYIEKGTRVMIIGGEGAHLIIEKIEEKI